MSTNVVKLPTRDEVKLEDTWDLTTIFSSDDAWEKELEAVSNIVSDITAYQGKLSSSAKTLLEALTLSDEIGKRVGVVYQYAHLKHDQDTGNGTYQSQEARAMSLYATYASATSYMTPEILAIDETVLNGFIAEDDGLKLYQQAIHKINKKRAHTLNEESEALLAGMSELASGPGNIFGKLNNADLKFPSIEDEDGNTVEVTHGNLSKFMESTNRDVRRSATEAVAETYKKYQNTYASILATNIKKDNYFAKVRNYNNARHAALSNNFIPETVYDQLVETVNENLHLLHRYIDLRKKILGLDELHSYDLSTPLLPESKMEVTYEESKQLVIDSLKIMGEEYSAIVEEGFNNRWVDIYENVGKRSGAYSSGTYGTNPYILMNWTDTVNNLFTLTHEFGHSVHSYLTRKNQPYPYANYSIFVAEVASTCNEALLNHYMLERTTDKNEKLYLLNNFLDGFVGTFFRQTQFAEFEHQIHLLDQEKTALTADVLTKLWAEIVAKYSGPAVKFDETAPIWARIPHFYYNYYVYQYATGYAAAQSLSKQILEQGEPAVNRYIESFLKAGSSDYPIEVLKKAGVDMNSKAPIEDALKVFEDYLNQMETLINE